MNDPTYQRLLDFLDRLDDMGVFHRISHPTPRCVMVEIAVPGERWEVEFHEDGEIGVEVFVSRAGVEDGGTVDELFARFSG